MTRRRSAARPGYTLLEILIASAIGLLLMSALYYSFDLTLTTSDAGRVRVAESDLNRAVINRMAIDLSSPLGVLPPKSGGSTEGASSSTASTDSSTTTTAAATTGTATATTGTTSTSGTSTSETTEGGSTAGTLLPLQAGVIGTSDQLILFVSKVPKWLTDRETAADPNALLPSDGHRISYYMHGSGKGLCRQDREWVTADKVGNSTDLDRSTEDAEVIAPEVVALQFEYADGTGYLSEWDGTQASLDGSSATGPPRAVKVTLTFEFTDREGVTAQKKIVHIFPIRSAIGLLQPDTTTTEGM